MSLAVDYMRQALGDLPPGFGVWSARARLQLLVTALGCRDHREFSRREIGEALELSVHQVYRAEKRLGL